MADHSKPTMTSYYADFVDEINARFDDLAVAMDPALVTATNTPNGSIRWSSAAGMWQKLSGTTWSNLRALNPVGSASAPSVTVGAANTGLYSLSGTVFVSSNGVQSAAIKNGACTFGNGAISDAVYLGLYGTSASASPIAYGAYSRITWTSDATKNTDIRQFQIGNTITLSDSSDPVTVAVVRGYYVSAPTLESANASSSITSLRQIEVGAVPDQKILAAYALYGNMALVSGVSRWNAYVPGTAPNYFAGDMVLGGNLLQKQGSVAAINTTSTLATASITGGIITTAPASAITLTLPAATDIAAAIPAMGSSQGFDWSVINTGSTYSATLVASASHAVIGNMVVAPGTSASFRTRLIGGGAFSTYRMA